MSMKSMVGLLVLLIVAVGAVYKFTKNGPFNESVDSPVNEEAVILIGNESPEHRDPGTDVVPVEQPVPVIKDKAKFTEEQKRQVVEWAQTRGLHAERWKSYINLSDADLKAIAETGDHEALQQLGARYSQKKPVEALEYFERAAVLDSTYALTAASGVWKNIENPNQELLEVGISTNRRVNALSYAFTALLRGDNYLAPDTVQQLTEKFSYSEEELKEACANAQLIYQDLAQKRIAMGLSDFDNSPSPYGVNIGEGLSSIEPCK